METNKELQEALKVLEENRKERLEQFQKELIILCQKYGVDLSSQIIFKVS